MTPEATLRAFLTVLPAELPDKTMLATIVLVTRFRRPLAVWVGAVGAFAVHVTVAVVAGSLLALLPERLVAAAVAALFLAGAVLLLRAARSAEDDDGEGATVEVTTPTGAAAAAFGLILLAEWGDLTQLATASLSARSGDPLGTAVGAWCALAVVAGIAATFGRTLSERVPLRKVNYVGAAVFAALGVWALYGAVSG